MKLFDRPGRPPQPTPTPARWEFFTNLAAPGEFVNGFEEQKTAARVCPLSHTPKTEENNNMTDPIAAIKAETQDLKNRAARLDQQNKIQAVKAENKQLKQELHDATVRKIKAETDGLKAQIARHKQEAEKRETAKMENELGIRFW